MAAEMIGGGRPMTTCRRCKQTDDHPVCSVLVGAGDSAHWEDWHTDCHQIAFGDMDCHPQCAAGAADGKTGADMLTAILDHHAQNAEG